jgi:FkbM family methyltransferase
MDDKLAKYLPKQGIFIEAGATDGYLESNTYFLEKFRGWKGVLIEPIPELYEKCVKERPNSKVFNCALVSNEYQGKSVVMKRGHLMSTVKGALGEGEKEHLERAAHFHGTDAEEVTVPARTLTSVLKEAGVSDIDFFSLDVEGYELNVLGGLDFNIYQPTYMLIEFLDEERKKDVESYITHYYTCAAQLSKRDFLYQRR